MAKAIPAGGAEKPTEVAQAAPEVAQAAPEVAQAAPEVKIAKGKGPVRTELPGGTIREDY